MALATQEDVRLRLGRDLSPAEAERAASLLDDASAVVIGYCRQDFSDAVPSAVAGVVAKMATRSLSRTGSEGLIEQQAAGPFNVHYTAASSSGDVWMTSADKLALRPHRKGGGLTSVPLVGSRYDITED